MSTGGAFSGTTSGTTRDSQGGVFNNVNSNVSADAGTGTGSITELLALIAAEAATRLANDNTEIGLREAADVILTNTKQNNLTAGANITIINDVIAASTTSGVTEAELAAAVAAEAALREAADTNLDTIKQDTLVAGTNITLTDNGNDTTTINAVGGGSGPITVTFTLRLDFDNPAQPTIVVNTGDTPDNEIVVDYTANSILDPDIPANSDVNVNGVPFILNTDYMISGGILQFTSLGYDLVADDGDVIVISAITIVT